MNKKILILSILTLFLIVLLSVSTSAATITSATITVTPSKTEFKAGETIDYTISLKDLNASDGILGFGAYIEYNSDLLTLNTKAKGLSDWSDATISETTHRFVTTKESHSSNNEDILKISFTVKQTATNAETTIALKKIEISNGAQYNISEVTSEKITIMPNATPSTTPTPTPTLTPTPTVTPPADQKPDDSKDNTENNVTTPTKPVDSNNGEKDSSTSGKIPSTGVNNYLSIIILALVIVAIVSFIKIKILNNRNTKQWQDFVKKDDENKK